MSGKKIQFGFGKLDVTYLQSGIKLLISNQDELICHFECLTDPDNQETTPGDKDYFAKVLSLAEIKKKRLEDILHVLTESAAEYPAE